MHLFLTMTATIKNVATELLGIEHPIVCGGMTATGSAELCAAVANAGCLGMLTCLHCRTPERLREEIARTRTLTSRPFGVNLTILGEKRGEPEFPAEFAAVIAEAGIRVVETCGASLPLMTQLHETLRAGGVEVIISKCVHVRQAVKAQDVLGADMISLMGWDSGGLPGEADTGMFVQLALARKSLRVPFLASGGVATGGQLLAALAMGAAGVQIGTAFNTTAECSVWPASFKARMLEAGTRDTVIIMKPFRASSRVLKNKDAAEILRIQAEKGSELTFKDIAPLAQFERLREGIAAADPDRGVWNCGQSVCLLDEVLSCEQFVQRLLSEARDSLQAVAPMFQPARL